MTHIRVEGSGEEFDQGTDDTVLRAALRAGIGFPYECNSGGCGSCRFQVVDGDVEDLWPSAPGRTERDRRTGRLLGCQSRATSDLMIRLRTSDEFVPDPRPARRSATLVAVDDVTHDMRRFTFAAEGPARFRPGQYALLSIPGVDAARCYSMSNLPNDSGHWEFVIRRVPHGEATTALFEHAPVGTEIALDAPYGLAWLRAECPRDIVCVAGGSGLAPMLSIARAAADARMLSTRELHFFHGARAPRDLCAHHLLDGLQVRLHPVVSMPESEPEAAWGGETGFVHEAVCRALGDRLGEFEWYFAGPPPMTQALQQVLAVEHRVPVDHLHFDRFF